MASNATLLKEYGGSLTLTFHAANQFFEELALPKGEQPVSPGFLKELGFSFHRAIKEVVNRYDIPDGLVINIDQTRLPFILLIKYTMDKKSQKPVPIANSANYSQVTGTFTITLSAIFYQSK